MQDGRQCGALLAQISPLGRPLPMDWTDCSMQPTDAVLTCRDCGGEFAFSDGERRDFAGMGRFHAPSRCAACRAERRLRQVESRMPVVAPRFRELQEVRSTVVCSSCGESTVVPFAARPGRSVYCSARFQRRRLEGDA